MLANGLVLHPLRKLLFNSKHPVSFLCMLVKFYKLFCISAVVDHSPMFHIEMWWLDSSITISLLSEIVCNIPKICTLPSLFLPSNYESRGCYYKKEPTGEETENQA